MSWTLLWFSRLEEKPVIGYLEGILEGKIENELLVNVNGVGYLIEVPSLFKNPAVGEKISAYVYTYVREDAIDLYGFNNMAERKLFKTILSVSRIGPKAGMNILSTLSYDQFIKAILGEKIEVLKEVSGIGPKTAQRLILELESKIDDLTESKHFSTSELSKTSGVIKDDELYSALNNLGYSSREIDNALSHLEINNEAPLQDKIKQILSFLGKESI